MKKKVLLILFAAVLMLVLASCGKKREVSLEPKFYIYYMETGKNELHPVEAEVDLTREIGYVISGVWTALCTVDERASYNSTVPKNLELNSYSLEDHDLVLNFSSDYNDMSKTAEILLRSAVVKTYTQIPDVSTVEIRVESQPLMMENGTAIGPQKGSDFVDVMGRGLNAYASTSVSLYFASEDGEHMEVVEREITYNTSNPLELHVVQALISGPSEESGLIRTLPADTKLISVSTKNGVCHVNLNDAVLKEDILVTPGVLIYSIVNSLTELNSITSVQISINGNSNMEFMGEISLESPLERNLNFLTIQTNLGE